MASPSPPADVDGIANAWSIPMFEVTELRNPAVSDLFAQFAPDLIVVSCFPWRLPSSVRSAARLGGVNLHPSFLPSLRGPDPIFWAYRLNLESTGVTIHHLSGQLDAGDILRQQRIVIANGMTGDELERTCAEIGGSLLVETTRGLFTGNVKGQPQSEESASYFSWPAEDDLSIPEDWGAKRIWHFCRGVIPLGYEPFLSTASGRFHIRAVLDVAPGQHDSTSLHIDDDACRVVRRDGAVQLGGVFVDSPNR